MIATGTVVPIPPMLDVGAVRNENDGLGSCRAAAVVGRRCFVTVEFQGCQGWNPESSGTP
jgi:hypothetical protein